MASGKCDICDKRTAFGRSIQFQHGGQWERRAPKTNRPFMPNIQSKRMFLDGKWQRVNVCTRCLRTEAKHTQVNGSPPYPKVAAKAS